MHDGQLRLTRSQVARLVARTLPEIRATDVRPVGGTGTTSYVYRLGDGLVARFPMVATDPARARAALHAEQRAMIAFRTVSPFPAPEPVTIGEPDEDYPLPWSIQTWVEGQVATPTSVAGSRDVAGDLVRLIEALRAADTGGRTFDGVGRGGDLSAHDAWVETCLRRSGGLLPVDELHATWSRLRLLPREDLDVMSHRDLVPANLLADGAGLRGVLDTGTFGPADPALDLVCAWHLLDAGPRDVVRRGLDVPDLQWARGAAWAFVQAMGLVWYYAESNPEMSDLGRSTLTRLLVAGPPT